MKNLSEKIKEKIEELGLSYRQVGEMVGLAHSTIYQIVVHKKTSLKKEVKEKLKKFSEKIEESDFTEIEICRIKKKKKSDDKIKELLEKYKQVESMKVRELRELYK